VANEACLGNILGSHTAEPTFQDTTRLVMVGALMIHRLGPRTWCCLSFSNIRFSVGIDGRAILVLGVDFGTISNMASSLMLVWRFRRSAYLRCSDMHCLMQLAVLLLLLVHTLRTLYKAKSTLFAWEPAGTRSLLGSVGNSCVSGLSPVLMLREYNSFNLKGPC